MRHCLGNTHRLSPSPGLCVQSFGGICGTDFPFVKLKDVVELKTVFQALYQCLDSIWKKMFDEKSNYNLAQ